MISEFNFRCYRIENREINMEHRLFEQKHNTARVQKDGTKMNSNKNHYNCRVEIEKAKTVP